MKRILIVLLLLVVSVLFVSQQSYAYFVNTNGKNPYYSYNNATVYSLPMSSTSLFYQVDSGDVQLFGFGSVAPTTYGRYDLNKSMYFYLEIPDTLLNDIEENEPANDPSAYVNIRIYNDDTSLDYYDDTLEYHISQNQTNPNHSVKVVDAGSSYVLRFDVQFLMLESIPLSLASYIVFTLTVPDYDLNYTHYATYGLSNYVQGTNTTANRIIIGSVYDELFNERDFLDGYASGYIAGSGIATGSARQEGYLEGQSDYHNGVYNDLDYAQGSPYLSGYGDGQDDYHGGVYGSLDHESGVPYLDGYGDSTANSEAGRIGIALFISSVLGSVFAFFFRLGSVSVLGISAIEVIGIVFGIAVALILFKMIFGR